MRFASLVAFAVFLIASPAALADSPAPQRPWVTVSERGGNFFKMVPGKYHFDRGKMVTDREPHGAAYQLTESGDFKELWRCEGWYTFTGYLSVDGMYFVRMGPWASDRGGLTDLAVAFYERGKLVKEYAVKDLLKKPDLITKSVSHYMWTPAKQTVPNGILDGSFHLVLIDKTTYRFDIKTGEIIETGTDEGAESLW